MRGAAAADGGKRRDLSEKQEPHTMISGIRKNLKQKNILNNNLLIYFNFINIFLNILNFHIIN